MKDKRIIYRIKHGSHLYGTNTPTSDLDYKEVFLPSGRDILLRRGKDAYSSGPDKAIGAKNQAGDIDIQSFSLHKLFDMCLKGDIVGMELLFASDFILERNQWLEVLENRHIFLSRKVDGYVGYCRQQANKYGIRGSRVASVRKVVEFLEPLYKTQPNTKFSDVVTDLSIVMNEVEHSHWEMIPNGADGTPLLHFVCCDRKAPVTNAIKEVYRVYKRVFDEYGERALMAEKNEGIDWKAMSHAIRVGQQAIELLDTGYITFPRPNAKYLVEIKKGVFDYKTIAGELDTLLEKVLATKENSCLPKEPMKEAVDDLLVKMYRSQIT